jgi:hypothetical protein
VTGLDAKMLREIRVDTSDAHTIGILADNGGEVAWYPHTCKPETLDRVEATIRKGLVEVIERIPHGLFLRLTDAGRHVAGELDKMKVAPKIATVANDEGAGSP